MTKATDHAPEPRELTALLGLVFLVAILAALTPIAVRFAVAELPPVSTGCFRFGIAGALLALTCRITGRRIRIERRHWLIFLVAAALCVPINQLGFLGGIKLANASHAGLFYALGPVLVFWASLLVRQTVFRWAMFAATLLSVAGALVAIAPGFSASAGASRADKSMLLGDGLLFIAILSWVAFVMISKPLILKYGPLQTLTVVFLLGTLLDLPLLFYDLGDFRPADVGWSAWAGFAFITVMTSYVNYLLWYNVIARHDITRVSVLVNIHFLFTVVIEHLVFGERIASSMVIGCAFTLAGVYLATRPSPKKYEQK